MIAPLFTGAFSALLILLYSLFLLPLEGLTEEARENAFAYRIVLSRAIVEATPSWVERRILTKIARHESRFDERVGRCEIYSYDGMGARTAWQIIPLEPGESRGLCLDAGRDAVVAIRRVRMSRAMCRHLEPRFQLAAYAAGNCESSEGQRLSEIRWP